MNNIETYIQQYLDYISSVDYNDRDEALKIFRRDINDLIINSENPVETLKHFRKIRKLNSRYISELFVELFCLYLEIPNFDCDILIELYKQIKIYHPDFTTRILTENQVNNLIRCKAPIDKTILQSNKNTLYSSLYNHKNTSYSNFVSHQLEQIRKLEKEHNQLIEQKTKRNNKTKKRISEKMNINTQTFNDLFGKYE